MNNDRVEKAALTVIFVVIAVLVGLGGWAVIELINWITSK